MRIEILDDGSGIAILDNICWRCGSKENITKHHAIPKYLHPKMNVLIPICEDCHDEINAIDLQGVTKFLYKVIKQIDDLTYFLRFKKWKKGTGTRSFGNGNKIK